MIIRFEKKYLSELYYKGKSSDKKHRYQPQIIERYKQRIDFLNEANSIEILYQTNLLNYEVLVGDKKGVSSIRVNNQYRIEFIVSLAANGEKELTVCNIIDLTNHYK